MYFFLISDDIWRNIQLHHQLSKSCVGAQIWILSLSCPSGLAVAQYLPHILWPTDIDNECKRSLGSDRDYPQHFCDGTWRGVSPASCHRRLEQAMNGAKAGLGMTCRDSAAPHSAGFGFVSNPRRFNIPIPTQHLETLLLVVFIQHASSSICLKCIMCHSGLRQQRRLWRSRRWECPEFVSSLFSHSRPTRFGQAETIAQRITFVISVPPGAGDIWGANEHLLALLYRGHKV